MWFATKWKAGVKFLMDQAFFLSPPCSDLLWTYLAFISKEWDVKQQSMNADHSLPTSGPKLQGFTLKLSASLRSVLLWHKGNFAIRIL
jgi:hypothetical protein